MGLLGTSTKNVQLKEVMKEMDRKLVESNAHLLQEDLVRAFKGNLVVKKDLKLDQMGKPAKTRMTEYN
jgi:hypothetical protein